jgi:predicted nucleotidyltransferase
MLTNKQIQILAIFTENPAKEFYLSEIGRIIGKQPGVFQKSINALVKESWLISSRRGNQRVFKVNASHPLFNEVKALIRKTNGAEAVLRKLMAGIKDVSVALVYGSYAKDRLRADSDIDLLVVAQNPDAEDILVKELPGAEKAIQREVNYKFYAVKDFDKRRKAKDPFLSEILSDKYILLKGCL